MAQAKRIVVENYCVKSGFSKATALPGHIKDSMLEKIESVISKPDKGIVVDKSRIVGFGSTTSRQQPHSHDEWGCCH